MNTPPRGVAARMVLALVIGSVGALAGCQGAPKPQGGSGLLATYSFTTLTTDLPSSAPVPSVIAAAEGVLRDRGYTVGSVEATEGEGRLIAWPPRYNNYPRMVVHAKRVDQATRVGLTYEPFGDEALSRGVLDRMLQRLGL